MGFQRGGQRGYWWLAKWHGLGGYRTVEGPLGAGSTGLHGTSCQVDS